MKIYISLLILTLIASCAHETTPERKTASANCYESIKVEYNSYFDSYEKCIEKAEKK